MNMYFMDERDIMYIFRDFAKITIDRAMTTWCGGAFLDDDFLIYAEK